MFTEDSPYLQCLLETAEAGQLTRERVFSGDLTQLRNAWDIALDLKLIERSMFPDVPRVLTSAGRSALARLRERGTARPIPIATNRAKRKGGRCQAPGARQNSRFCERGLTKEFTLGVRESVRRLAEGQIGIPDKKAGKRC